MVHYTEGGEEPTGGGKKTLSFLGSKNSVLLAIDRPAWMLHTHPFLPAERIPGTLQRTLRFALCTHGASSRGYRLCCQAAPLPLLSPCPWFRIPSFVKDLKSFLGQRVHLRKSGWCGDSGRVLCLTLPGTEGSGRTVTCNLLQEERTSQCSARRVMALPCLLCLSLPTGDF